jgi:hypothetical protein
MTSLLQLLHGIGAASVITSLLRLLRSRSSDDTGASKEGPNALLLQLLHRSGAAAKDVPHAPRLLYHVAVAAVAQHAYGAYSGA